MTELESGGMTREREAELRERSTTDLLFGPDVAIELLDALDATRKLLDAEMEDRGKEQAFSIEKFKSLRDDYDAEKEAREGFARSRLLALEERDAARREAEEAKAERARYGDTVALKLAQAERLSERHEALREAVADHLGGIRLQAETMGAGVFEQKDIDVLRRGYREYGDMLARRANILAQAIAADEPEAPAPWGGEEAVDAEMKRRGWDKANERTLASTRLTAEDMATTVGPVSSPAPSEEKPVSAYCKECRGYFLPPHEHEEVKSV